MSKSEYHKAYWKKYKTTHRQISLTLTHEEYREWERRAEAHGNRSVGQQIKAEAKSYQAQEFIPTELLENKLDELSRLWRGMANNLNQIAHHSNYYRELIQQEEAIKLLQTLEQEARDFISQSRASKN